MRELVGKVHEVLDINNAHISPIPFIVHGHSDIVKLSLKNYLQNTLKLSEPIILHEQPNQGRTIIEKFEDYAAQSCLVFVLLTPDDVIAAANVSEGALDDSYTQRKPLYNRGNDQEQ